MDWSLPLADILAARRTIAGVADDTPQLLSPFLSDIAGHSFWLKLESLQPIGAFKLRGAVNAVSHLPKEVNGVTCCSTGNHGRGVAFAAQRAGIEAVICMSSLVPETKREGIRALGGTVRIIGQSQDDAQRESERLAREEGLVEISPFDNPHVIAGQGTIGVEMLEATPDLTSLLVPLSGGGLAAGVALAAKAINPCIQVIGLSMDRGAAMHASLQSGHPVEVTEYVSLADSLGGGIGLNNQLSFPMCRDLLDGIVLVTEEEIRDAMQALYFEERLVAEGACVVGIAALLAGKLPQISGPVGTIITGRNVDMTQFTRVVSGQDVMLGDVTLEGRRYAA
ncbi:hydroxyectoine utilization dehydratase EutB [Oceaniradius stylonematis]|uniref:hydroxyectoine utilization dehydratase EutB n=1 Tax=Oceaniradius stylonematis TaxID=2184161 RepID=UPI00273F513E|nr:hydroxyectoine utilization dehydratase EutB [Oceaniradius stylonematis]